MAQMFTMEASAEQVSHDMRRMLQPISLSLTVASKEKGKPATILAGIADPLLLMPTEKLL